MGLLLPPANEQRLRRLLDVGRSLVSELDLEVVLERVLTAARELTGARYAALGVLDEQRRALERFLVVGIDEPQRRVIGDLPRGHGVLGVLIRDPRPLRLAQVGEHAQSFGFPPEHPPMSSFLGVPILIRDESYGNLYLTEKQGRAEFTDEDEEAAVVLAEWAAIAIRNARSFTVVDSRRDELERAVATLEATGDLARVLAGETDTERVLELVVKRGRALADARSALVILERGGGLEIAATAGEIDPALCGQTIDGVGVVGDVVRGGRPERIPDVQGRLRFPIGEHAGAQAGLLVPLTFRGRPLGAIAVFDRLRDGPEFGAWDEHVLTSFAATASAAVATALQVAQQERRRAVAAAEEERRRWARELHDETLQELAALKLMIAVARGNDDRQGRDEALAKAAEEVDAAVGSLRRLITDLRPAALDAYGLGPALAALAERSQESGLEVTVDAELEFEAGRAAGRLSREVEDAVYRFVQEALTNVAKHAAATTAHVVVREQADVVEALVRDDGRGFDSTAETAGFGLIGMRERATLLGGTVAIEAAPGAGTTARLRVPVARADAAAA